MIVDLSHPLGDGIQTFPGGWHPNVAIQTMGRLCVEGRRSTRIELGTHTATHIDAPSHFLEDGASIDQIPLELLAGEASVVDFRHLSHRTEVSGEAMDAALPQQMNSPRLLLCFGWSRHFNSSIFYDAYPYLSREAAEVIIDRGVRLLGYDTPSPDNPNHGRDAEVDSPIHKAFLTSNVWLLEYLNNLDALPANVHLYALPLPLVGLDGAPARCIGVVDDH